MLFVALAIGVFNGGPLVRLDQSTADALHTYASEVRGLTEFFALLASRAPWGPRSRGRAGRRGVPRAEKLVDVVAWLVAVLGGEALNLLLKDYSPARPSFEHPLVVETPTAFRADRQWSPGCVRDACLFAMLTLEVRGCGLFRYVERLWWP